MVKTPPAWWGGPPGPRGTPSSRCRNNDIGILWDASRPTGASAADRGVRPTNPAGRAIVPVFHEISRAEGPSPQTAKLRQSAPEIGVSPGFGRVGSIDGQERRGGRSDFGHPRSAEAGSAARA